VPLSLAEVLVELVVLFAITFPTGATVLRLAERFFGRSLQISLLERLLVSFYVVGGLLFLIASIPVPWYGLPAICLLLLTGGAGYAILAIRDRGVGLRSVARWTFHPVGIALVLGTLALLFVEASATWNLPLSNSYDGSMISLWSNLTIANHTLPWTLAPYANWGVTYPLSTTVWMTVPALLFGWPISQVPLLLSPLFLSLTIPAAYCLGTRMASPARSEARDLGLLFAAFFGLVASWPRLFVGGSYDFAFAMPLLLVMFGWARPFVEGAMRPWKEVVGFGLLVGVLAALNVAAAQFFVLVLIGFVVVFRSSSAGSLGSWFGRMAVIAGTGLLFLVRSVLGLVVWFSYPGHVLQETGSAPYVPPPIGYALSQRLVMGEIDPFVRWKAKLTPFPFLALELQVLLVVGLVVLVLCLVVRNDRIRSMIPIRATQTIGLGMLVALLFTSFLLVPLVPGSPISSIEWASSLDEVSVILFTFFGLVALLPLAVTVKWFDLRRQVAGPVPTEFAPSSSRPRRWMSRAAGDGVRARYGWFVPVVLVLVVAVPLGSGVVATVWEVPGYLQTKTLSTGNATAQDVDALQWAGTNLAPCSRVLVAPGSAGQFLPEFAKVGLVYPMLPVPVNLSYITVVGDLVRGTYNASARSALLSLDISEILGTGETFGGYPPFNLTQLLQTPAPDFKVLFAEGDASILEFLPVAQQLDCAA